MVDLNLPTPTVTPGAVLLPSGEIVGDPVWAEMTVAAFEDLKVALDSAGVAFTMEGTELVVQRENGEEVRLTVPAGKDGSNVVPTNTAVRDTVTGDLATPGSAIETAFSAKIAEETAGKADADSVPSLEESFASVVLDAGSIATTQTRIVAVTPYPISVDQASIAVAAPVAASDTNYWRIQLMRYRSGSGWEFASKTTRTLAGAGEAMPAYGDWNFDLRPFGPYAVFAKGDVLAVRMTPVGAPPPLVAPLITFRAPVTDAASPASPTAIVVDSFDRPDSATSMGNADTGQAWSTTSFPWGISGNQAYAPNTANVKNAWIDAGVSDFTAQVKLSAIAASGSLGLLMCYIDDSNDIECTSQALYKKETNALALLVAFSQTFVAGDTMRVVKTGSSYTVFRDAGSTGAFVQVGAATSTFNQTVTRHGLRQSANAGGANRFDDYSIVVA